MAPTWRDGIHASRDQPIEKIVLVTPVDSSYVLDENGDIFVSRVMMVSSDGYVRFKPIDQMGSVRLPMRAAIWYPNATNLVMATDTDDIFIWLGA